MRWPKYWGFSFSIIPSKEIPGLMSFRMGWYQGSIKAIHFLLNTISVASHWFWSYIISFVFYHREMFLFSLWIYSLFYSLTLYNINIDSIVFSDQCLHGLSFLTSITCFRVYIMFVFVYSVWFCLLSSLIILLLFGMFKLFKFNTIIYIVGFKFTNLLFVLCFLCSYFNL